eukprot:g2485.t1
MLQNVPDTGDVTLAFNAPIAIALSPGRIVGSFHVIFVQTILPFVGWSLLMILIECIFAGIAIWYFEHKSRHSLWVQMSSHQPSRSWLSKRGTYRIDSEMRSTTEGGQQPTIKHVSDGIYYAFIAWTSVGFGDMTPLTRVGKFVTISWTITGVLQIILLGGLLINNLSELTTQSAESMLLQYGEQNSLQIGSFNGTNAAYLAKELAVHSKPKLFGSVIGVLQNETITRACDALCSGAVDALVADANLIILCFQQWQQTCSHRVSGIDGKQTTGGDQLQYSIVTNQEEPYLQIQASSELVDPAPGYKVLAHAVNNIGTSRPSGSLQAVGVQPQNARRMLYTGRVLLEPHVVVAVLSMLGVVLFGIFTIGFMLVVLLRRNCWQQWQPEIKQSSLDEPLLSGKSTLIQASADAVATDIGNGDANAVDDVLTQHAAEMDAMLARHRSEIQRLRQRRHAKE